MILLYTVNLSQRVSEDIYFVAMTSTYRPVLFPFLTVPPFLACGAPIKSSILLALLIPVDGLDGGPEGGRFGGMSDGGILSLSGPGVSLRGGVAALDPGPDGGGILELLCGFDVGGLEGGADIE